MSRLPEEIIQEEILTRLPVKSISRFRCVSRNWSLLFQNPNFIKNHLNHAIQMNKFNILVTHAKHSHISVIDYNVLHSTSSPMGLRFQSQQTICYRYNVLNSICVIEVLGHAFNKIDYPRRFHALTPLIIGSCNGLVCIEPCTEDICIWNPATREYKELPRQPAASFERVIFARDGFGFDRKNDEYKVVRIVRGDSEDEVAEPLVYSSTSNSWKKLGIIPYAFKGRLHQGILVNGVLHWIACRMKSWVVVCFDILDERFYQVPLPNNISLGEDQFTPDLGVWEGKLCLLHTEDTCTCTQQNDHFHVSTMMDNKWTENLKVKITTDMKYYMDYGRPFQTLQNGDILFEGGEVVGEGNCLLSYDPYLEKARALKIHGFPKESEVETYIETLLPLNSGTYVGNWTPAKSLANKLNKKEKKRASEGVR